MSTREALIREIEKQPEPILREVQRYLEILVAQPTSTSATHSSSNGWPQGYFESTAGAFAEERFERPEQLPSEKREEW
jgi:hypothetical protein